MCDFGPKVRKKGWFAGVAGSAAMREGRLREASMMFEEGRLREASMKFDVGRLHEASAAEARLWISG